MHTDLNYLLLRGDRTSLSGRGLQLELRLGSKTTGPAPVDRAFVPNPDLRARFQVWVVRDGCMQPPEMAGPRVGWAGTTLSNLEFAKRCHLVLGPCKTRARAGAVNAVASRSTDPTPVPQMQVPPLRRAHDGGQHQPQVLQEIQEERGPHVRARRGRRRSGWSLR